MGLMMGGRMPGELSFIVLYGNSPGRSREGQRVENGRRRHHCDGPGNRPGSVNSDLRVVLRCNRWHFQSAITIFRIRKVGIFLIKFPHMTSTSGGANKWEKYARTTSPLPAPPRRPSRAGGVRANSTIPAITGRAPLSKVALCSGAPQNE